MLKSKKHWLSFLTLIVFMFFAVASKTSNTHKETFSYEDSYEIPSPQGNFIEMNDGSKVYGNDISWKTGLTVKDIITLDKEKYKISDVKGFMRYGNYYTRYHKEYIQRLVHGKINVYVRNVDVVTTTPMNGHNYTDVKNKIEYYYQIGEDGDLKKFDRSDIQGLLQDCPAAAKMADISKKQLQKELEDDPTYMNKVFHLYSNCK